MENNDLIEVLNEAFAPLGFKCEPIIDFMAEIVTVKNSADGSDLSEQQKELFFQAMEGAGIAFAGGRFSDIERAHSMKTIFREEVVLELTDEVDEFSVDFWKDENMQAIINNKARLIESAARIAKENRILGTKKSAYDERQDMYQKRAEELSSAFLPLGIMFKRFGDSSSWLSAHNCEDSTTLNEEQREIVQKVFRLSFVRLMDSLSFSPIGVLLTGKRISSSGIVTLDMHVDSCTFAIDFEGEHGEAARERIKDMAVTAARIAKENGIGVAAQMENSAVVDTAKPEIDAVYNKQDRGFDLATARGKLDRATRVVSGIEWKEFATYQSEIIFEPVGALGGALNDIGLSGVKRMLAQSGFGVDGAATVLKPGMKKIGNFRHGKLYLKPEELNEVINRADLLLDKARIAFGKVQQVNGDPQQNAKVQQSIQAAQYRSEAGKLLKSFQNTSGQVLGYTDIYRGSDRSWVLQKKKCPAGYVCLETTILRDQKILTAVKETLEEIGYDNSRSQIVGHGDNAIGAFTFDGAFFHVQVPVRNVQKAVEANKTFMGLLQKKFAP
ncbi:MAG TPA: hypothetical protein DCY07_00885 [Rhodospirillaceae bacterium]|nr:hypothetical protein [Rhodospirillaceae bacterium]